MKIQSSDICMTSTYAKVEKYSKEESLKMWVGEERPDFEGRGVTSGSPANVDVAEISARARALLAESNKCAAGAVDGDTMDIEISDKDLQKLTIIKLLLEKLTGKKINFYVPKKIKTRGEGPAADLPRAEQSRGPQRQGWGLEYDYHESYSERERMSFAASGVVRTADGREINFSVQLNMSREFAYRHDISIRAGDAVLVDPLVINFGGKAPELTDAKFSFDLDCDGFEDRISFVRPGSGFLALDLNEDGIINNGSELFGPASGDGFAELAQYDQDKNGWIDENDEIYHRLRIWTKDDDGADRLIALGAKGIGAIYLGSINTLFDLKDNQNELQGQISRSGIYVTENGTVGTIQQVDLTI